MKNSTSKTTSNIIEYLGEFSIDFGTESLYEKYREFSQMINVEDFVNYKELKSDKNNLFSEDAFHSVICVKVSIDTPFIPFFSILGNEKEQDNLEKMGRELQRKGTELITYNYSSFLEDIEREQNRMLMRLSFDTSYTYNNDGAEFSITNERIIGLERSKEKLWFEQQETDLQKKDIGDQMSKYLLCDGSFAKQISKEYAEKFGVNDLHFSIFSMDANYNESGFLTRLMLIGTNAAEFDFYLRRRLDRIREFVSCIRTRYIYDIHRRNLWEATKSAKAAIMARNMSHNLGSHVMFYIKQKLQSVSKIVDSSVLENIILPGDLLDIETLKNRISENTNVELPFLVGLGNFINYLQERQDYIATIATDYIPANSTISFKDFIYDELKPELRYKRHHADNTEAGWQPGNLLLDYIAYSERYRSSDDIVIKFNEFNGENAKDEYGKDTDDFKELRKFNIAVPGGVIGRQAIFSIFENIIRNAAKHSGRRNDNKLVLQLSVLGKDNNLFKSADFKSIRNDDKAKYDESGYILKEKYEECLDKYHVLRIKIDMPNDPETISKLVNKLADPYLEENGNMKESSKGLKEMRISAAWLRGYSIDTEIPADEPPALSIYTEPYDDDNSKVTISYILCIPKPCRVAFIASNNATDMNEILSPYGCKVFTHEQLSGEKLVDEIANYEIVCMSKQDKNICSRISSRYIINGNQSKTLLRNLINSIKNTNNKDEETKKDAIENTIGSVYETWLNAICPHAIDTKLCVADEKASQNDKKDKCLSDDDRVILTETGCVHKDDVGGAVVYSTHFKGLASKSNGPNGYNTWLEDAISIESVTGNNSTARLIRQDEWNKKWKTKLISAGLAKVAIFDERIFSSFISRKSITPRDGLNADVIIEEKKKFKNYGDFENELYKKYRVESSDALQLFTAKNRDQICKILKKYSITYTYDVAQKNHERRIWAFDVRLSEINPNEVEIVGYNTYIGERVGKYIEHKYDVALPIDEISYPVTPMARISYDRGICKVTLCDNEKVFKAGKSEVFDYITIHQGVLDKIYTAFGIKDNVIGKYRITNALHRCFSKHDTPKNKKAFLPNFIIHSGRSKPCVADMPQPQPFVQFAAVDHAVKDCKYTLVELLATAHYEKGNNNN